LEIVPPNIYFFPGTQVDSGQFERGSEEIRGRSQSRCNCKYFHFFRLCDFLVSVSLELQRARELVRDCIAAIAKREALDAQENTLMYETAIRLEEASRQEDIKRFSENLKAVSNTLIESQAKRKQILDEIEADTSTAPYHPGTWTTYFNKKDQRFYHWWTCCQQIGAGCESSPGCHNRRPRDLTLGKLEGGSLPRLEFE
jgi:hypothetical protein